MSRIKDFETLKTNSEFRYFYNNSAKKHVRSCIVFFKKGRNKKVGFTASKKIGNAVERNFAKRRLRALFVELNECIREGVFIFVAKKEILDMDYGVLKKDLSYALKRVGAFKG